MSDALTRAEDAPAGPDAETEPAGAAEGADGADAVDGADGAGRSRADRWRGRLIVVAFLIVGIIGAALFKSYIAQSFIIPSGSMENTLKNGDRVVVTRYDATNIHRGDIVVFADPGDWLNDPQPTGLAGLARDALIAARLLPDRTGDHLIKRVIGMPGDHVVADGVGPITVNGIPVSEPYIKPGRAPSELAFDVVVPPGKIWVMGDNRSNSEDSRHHQDDANGGFVPLDDVVGVAKSVVWPVSRWGGLSDGREAFSSVPPAS
ncbi:MULTISPECIES: signal peptidase I [Actinomyces]|uniref:Signal peptidase I n=1 Tax=Actinomyces marmotae TaxID=2737173 RepID=A0A6M8AZ30_9ACTO|nr:MULTISPECIES: signal peptidase I [Actinomyces]QKD79484.1 signal peptidase I [Actinomyces marmotae]